jgi:hypothetical protein
MEDKSEIVPWDYFLTNYERDLLRLPVDETWRKYPGLSREQVESDLLELQKNQTVFKLYAGLFSRTIG